MKKMWIGLEIVLLFMTFISPALATSGELKSNSIISCNEVTYGYHGSDKHYHVANKKNDNYYAKGDSLGIINPCTNETNNKIKGNEKITVSLNKCVDGDTASFVMDGENVKFRFLAIDTPETVHPTKSVEAFGKNASEYTCNKLTNAKKIEVEFDFDSELQDKYQRYLAWIWVDDSLLQKELIEVGYAFVAYIYGDYMYTNDLCISEQSAIKNSLGIWSDPKKELGYCKKLGFEMPDRDNKVSNENEIIKDDNSKELIGILMILFGSSIYYITKGRKKTA